MDNLSADESSMLNTLKVILRSLLPFGLVMAVHRHRARQNHLAMTRADVHRERHQLIEKLRSTNATRGRVVDPFDYPGLIGFHVARGLARLHVTEGSIPAGSLSYIRETLASAGFEGPVHGLHIGNYVGVSLAYVTQVLVSIHPESRVFAIDPNIQHRGTSNPQSHVAALLAACGLKDSVVILAGFSGRKSVSNDGVIFDGYDPLANNASEISVENVLDSLGAVLQGNFRFALLDGNHEADYLRNEINRLKRLLAPDAIVVLDDVDEAWAELKTVFEEVRNEEFSYVGTDGRVGILQHRPRIATG